MTGQSIDNLETRFRAGDRGALARSLSLVENEHPAGTELLRRVTTGERQAHVVGITGPPGAGKSSLISALIPELRSSGQTVGVIAVDPSSRITGGATLGDRVRMLDSWDDMAVFIRSMATRGQRGGLSRAVASSINLLEAFGFDVIVLETVGIGQDEIDVATVAETVVLLQVPGLGDSVQAIKAGVLEVADIYVVNKCDLPGAEEIFRDLNSMIRMSKETAWTTPVLQVSTSDGSGVRSLVEEINRHKLFLQETVSPTQIREQRICAEAIQIAMQEIEIRLNSICFSPESIVEVEMVATGRLSAREFADALLSKIIAATD